VPGHEVAGVVEGVGGSCRGWSVGDHLALAPDVHCGACWYCRRGMFNLCDDLEFVGITPGRPGGMAERMAVSGEVLRNGIVHRMPDGMAFVSGCLAEPACSVIACHERAVTQPGDTVLVLGAGPMGCLHVAMAHARGARAVVSEPGPERRRLAERFAPELVIDPAAEDLVTRVRDVTGGRGADLVVCANPVAATQADAVRAVRKAGRVVLFGGLPKDLPLTTLDSNLIHYGEIEVVGAFSYHPAVHEQALDLIHRGVVQVDPLVTHRFGVEEVEQAFRTAASGEGLKVVITSEGAD
jgi:L-iditol 2-dehydrogenase